MIPDPGEVARPPEAARTGNHASAVSNLASSEMARNSVSGPDCVQVVGSESEPVHAKGYRSLGKSCPKKVPPASRS